MYTLDPVIYWTTLAMHPILCRIWNTRFRARWLMGSNRGCTHFPCQIWSSPLFLDIELCIYHQCEGSQGHWMSYTPPPSRLDEPRMVKIFWACSPNSFKHIYFWFSFLYPHRTTYCSKYRCLVRKSNQVRATYLGWYTKYCCYKINHGGRSN